MSDKGDHSIFLDCIQDDIRMICDRLDLRGDHCLFMRASDDGVMATGSKKGELFLDQQPEICQQFRAFCSDEVIGVVSADVGQTNPECRNDDREIRKGGRDSRGTTNLRTASKDNRTARQKDGAVKLNTSVDLVEEMKTSSRPKRTMCTPIRLRGFETCLNKDTDSHGKRTQSKCEGKNKSNQLTTTSKLGGNTTTNKLGGNTTTSKLGGNTTTSKLGGNTTTSKLGGNTTTSKLGGNTTTSKLGGNTTTSKLGGNTTTSKLGGNTTTSKLGGNTTTSKLGGNTTTSKLGGNTTTSKLGGNTVTSKIGGNTTTSKLGGNTTTSKLGGNTVTSKIGGNTVTSKIGGNTTTSKRGGIKLVESITEGQVSNRKSHVEATSDQQDKDEVGPHQQNKKFKGITKAEKNTKRNCLTEKHNKLISNTRKRSSARSKHSEREDDEGNGTYEEEFVDDDNDEDYEAGQSSENEADAETYSPSTRALCDKHVKIKKNQGNFKCEKCDAMFVLQRNFKRHMENNVCDTVIAKRRKLDNADKASDSVIKLGEEVVKKVTPLSTLPGETTVKEEQENSTVGDDSVQHKKARKRKPVIIKDRYKCDNCGFVLSNQESLRRHYVQNGCPGIKLKLPTNVTDKQDSYKCDFCDRRPFTSLFLYQKHVLRHQIASSTKSSQFQCSLCNKEFMYDRERVAHMFRIHKKRGPVGCQVCGHSFMSLNDHLKHRKYCSTIAKCEGVGQKATPAEGQQATPAEGPGEATVKVESTGDCQEQTTSQSRGKTTADSHSQSQEDSQLGVVSIPDIKGQITQNGKSGIELKVKLGYGTTIMFDASKIYRSFVVDSDGNSGNPRSGKSVVPSSDVDISDDDQVAMSEIEQDCEPDTVPLVCKTCDQDICSLFVGDSVDNTCQVCRRLFPNSYQLNKHQVIHSASQLYQCHKCDKCFVEPTNLHRHLRVIHKLRYTVCRHCCGLCVSRKNLVKHMKEKHASQYEKTCRMCREQFADRSQCMEHEEKEHQIVPDQSEKGCMCDQCGKVFTCRSSLKAHIDWHNNVRPYECPHCKRRYRRKRHLTIHLQTHSSAKKYQCEVCGDCFTLKETLSRHVRVHNDRKQYECQYCDMKFRTTDGLNHHTVRNHVKVVDIGKLKFKVRQCEICGLLSASKQQYNLHMARQHMTSRPYKCRLCAHHFGTRSILLEHIRKIHQLHGIHTCLICNQKAGNSSKWKRHMRTKKHVELCEQSGIDPEGLEQGMHYIIGGSDALAKETNVEHLMEWIGEGDESEYMDKMDRKANCVPTTEHETHRGKWQRKQTRTNASVRKQASTNEGTKPPMEDVDLLEEVTQTVESVTLGQQNIQIIIDTHVDDGSRPVQILEAQEAVDSILQMDDLVQGQNNTIDDTTVQRIVYVVS